MINKKLTIICIFHSVNYQYKDNSGHHNLYLSLLILFILNAWCSTWCLLVEGFKHICTICWLPQLEVSMKIKWCMDLLPFTNGNHLTCVELKCVGSMYYIYTICWKVIRQVCSAFSFIAFYIAFTFREISSAWASINMVVCYHMGSPLFLSITLLSQMDIVRVVESCIQIWSWYWSLYLYCNVGSLVACWNF